MNSFGLLPAVSTMRMPLSMITCMYSAYGGGVMAGRMVRFTPNGRSVIVRQRAISAQVLRRRLRQRRENAESARVRDRRGELGVPTHCMPP